MLIFKTHNLKRNKDPFVIKEDGVKYRKLEKVSYKTQWVEDSFLEEGGSRQIVGRTFNFDKLKSIGIILLLLIGLLIGRAFYLQIVNGQHYASLADGNSIRLERIEAKRGIIYDRNKTTLVRNVANFLLYFIPIDLPDDENERNRLIEKVARIVSADDAVYQLLLDDIKSKVAQIKIGSLESYQPLFILDNIEYERALKLFLETDRMPGVILSNKSRREYVIGDTFSMSHILGYVSKISQKELDTVGKSYSPIDYIGKTGIEVFWENDLRGVNGRKNIEVDALGNEKKVISKIDEEDGHNLVLSIDFDLQSFAEKTLQKYLDDMDLNKGSVLMMDPRNGEVLAIVSLPAFDNNIFAKGISQSEYSALINDINNPLFNRSISGEYPSGSTIKPVMAQAALEERIISENTSFLSTGGLRIGQWFFPDWNLGGHGSTNVRKAISQSVNTFFYYIGGGYEDFVGLGVEKIGTYLNMFGLGNQLGIDLPGEASGFVPTREWKEEAKNEAWYIGDTYHLAIGQGDLLTTPLQVANFTSVFANRGSLYRPHLVKEILNSNDELIANTEDYLIKKDFLDSYNLEVVRRGMRDTVTLGSGRYLSTLPVAVAGKTGTAQWSSLKDPHAWFTGFAPYQDPEVVITVLVEEGKEGSAVATRITYEILKYFFDKEGKNE